MKLHRALRLAITLLFALLLPVHSYAVMWHCEQTGPATSGAATSASAGASGAATSSGPQAEQRHCAAGSVAAHPHGCGNGCCAAAIALSPARWMAPRTDAPEISLGVDWPSPAVTLDRLDRPPRPA